MSTSGRPALGKVYERRLWHIDVQPSPGESYEYMGCVTFETVDIPKTSLTRREAPNPSRSGEFVFAGHVRGGRGNVTLSYVVRRNSNNALAGLENCLHSYRARYACTGPADDINNFETIDQFCDAMITSLSANGYTVMNSEDNDNGVEFTVSAEAGEAILHIGTVTAERIQDDWISRAINKIRYCDSPSCGECDDLVSDGCEVWFGVTDTNTGHYPYPLLLKHDGRQRLEADKWDLYTIDAFSGSDNVVDLWCFGDHIVVISPTGGFAYSPDGGLSWQAVTGMVSGHGPNALYANGREVWACGDGGYIYKSNNAGVTWDVEDDGGATTEDLQAIAGFASDAIIAVGDNGAVVRTQNQGRSWSALTGPSADDLTAIAFPRSGQPYVGTDVGTLWRGFQSGDSWEQVALPVAGAGTINDIVFCGPCGKGEFGYIAYDAPGPEGQVWRSLDGGASWSQVSNVPDNAGLNTVACCDHSTAVSAGEVYNALYAMIVEIDKD